MAARRTLSLLLLAAAILAIGAVPVLGQTLDFNSGRRVTFGFTDQGPVGGVCTSSVLAFSRSTGGGTITGTLLSGSDVRCGASEGIPISDGSLTLFTSDRSVVGTLGDEMLFGQLLPAGHGFVAVDTLGFNSSIPGGFGLSVFVEPNDTTFAQSNLTGTWRIRAVTGDQSPEGPGGVVETVIGSITVSEDGSVTGTLGFPDFEGTIIDTETIDGGTLTLDADGHLTGSIDTTSSDGESSRMTDVNGLMAPDKNFVAGVTHSERFGVKQGMFFLQREPTGISFSLANLAGTWSIFVLIANASDSSAGVWLRGTLTFNSVGKVTAAKLVVPDGGELAVRDSGFTVSRNGVVNGVIRLDSAEPVFLTLTGTMFKEKTQVIGVNALACFGCEEGASAFTGLFTMIKQPPASMVQFSAGNYSVMEGMPATIPVNRTGAMTTDVTVDYLAFDPSTEAVLASGTLTIPATRGSASFTVPTTNDFIVDGNQAITLQLSNPTNGATLGTRTTANLDVRDVDRGGVIVFSPTVYTVSEGAGNVSITLKRTGGSAANVSVVFTTVNGTAIAGTDYGSVDMTVVFDRGEMTKNVLVPILQNLLIDGERRFTIVLSSARGGATLGTPATATASVKIQDDDSTIQFESTVVTAREGTPGVFNVVRSGALVTTAVVSYNLSIGAAIRAADFSGPVSGILTFRPGVRRQSFMVSTLNNTQVDGNRSFFFTLGTPTGGAQLGPNSTARLHITDDDQPGVFRMGSASYSVREGAGFVSVDIIRQPAPGNKGPLGANISVGYATSSGNASSESDFTHVEGIAVFAALQTKQTIKIPISQDALVEGRETFFFSLSSPSDGATLGSPSSASITIEDDDVGGVVFLNQRAYKVNEGAGNISITVVRSGGRAGNVSVDFATVTDSAIDDGGGRAPRGLRPAEGSGGADYGAVFRTLTFAEGEMSKTVVIPIYQDGIAEGDETFLVTLSNPQGGLRLGNPASAPVTIVDDEVVIQFSGKFRNNQPEVIRTGPLSANVSVQYVAESGTAILGTDFVLPPGTLVFRPGVSSQLIPIKTTNDNIAEGPETFTITLFNPSAPAQLGERFTESFTIYDNDFGGTVSFSNTSITASPGDTTIGIVRTGGAGTVLTIGLAVIGGTANPETDFVLSSPLVTFQAPDTSGAFRVTTSPSAAGKTIVFGLLLPGGPDGGAATFGAANVSTLTILGPTSVIEFSSATYSVTEDEGVATITVKRSGDLSQPATVNYATSNGTATTSNEDYSPTSGTLSFPASEGSYQHASFTIGISDDGEPEGPETVNLTLSNAVGAALGERSTAVLTINDPVVVPAPGYSFTVLYSGGVTVGLPSISDNGQFAFSIESGSSVVYSGNLDAPTDLHIVASLPGEGVQSIAGSRFPVDGGENVAFLANLTLGGLGIVLDSNTSASSILAATDESVLDLGEPSLSLNGTVAFRTTVDCDGSCYEVQVGMTSTGFGIAARSGDSVDDTFLDAIGPITAVNDSGIVAFVGTTFAGTSGIFTGNASSITTIASSADFAEFGQNVSINFAGDVVFIGTDTAGVMGVVLGRAGNNPFVVASNASGFSSFPTASGSSPVIGNGGTFAFVAERTNGVRGIYTGPDPVTSKVVEVGDIVDGRMVTDVRLGGINAGGQISFLATLQQLTPPLFSEVAAIVATPPDPFGGCGLRCLPPPLGLRAPR